MGGALGHETVCFRTPHRNVQLADAANRSYHQGLGGIPSKTLKVARIKAIKK